MATRTALLCARAAAVWAARMSPPNSEPTRAMADELVNLAGRLLCAAREAQLRCMGVPEAKQGD